MRAIARGTRSGISHTTHAPYFKATHMQSFLVSLLCFLLALAGRAAPPPAPVQTACGRRAGSAVPGHPAPWQYPDAAVEIEGYPLPACPTSSIVQGTLLWALIGEVIELLPD